ncbi:MAG: amidohydrolase family protein [Armatimonadota bacterium]|nr:amidohydrolase family protein [bacterium]MDW8321452.1 amidohydrolase family protein [Armatimonadota bacterium]
MPTAIINVTVWNGSFTIKPGFVLWQGDTIADVGRADVVRFSSAVKLVDGKGGWVIPGLIDLHVHVDEVKTPELFVRYGVTSVRDMGSSPQVISEWRRRWREGQKRPYVYWTGRNIDTGKPSWWEAVAVKQVAEVPGLLEHLRKLGADGFKLYVNADSATAEAVIDYARWMGLPVTAHHETIPASDLLRMGISGIEHAHCLLHELLPSRPHIDEKRKSNYLRVFSGFDRLSVEGERVRRLMELAYATSVVWTPTLSLYDIPPWWRSKSPAGVPVPASWRAEWSRPYWDFLSTRGWTPADFRIAERALEVYKRFVREAHRYGVQVGAGTDTPAPGLLPGAALHHELRLLVESGLSPEEALRATTATAARALRQEGRVGVLAAGARADMVLLEKSPLERVENLLAIRKVYVRGREM